MATPAAYLAPPLVTDKTMSTFADLYNANIDYNPFGASGTPKFGFGNPGSLAGAFGSYGNIPNYKQEIPYNVEDIPGFKAPKFDKDKNFFGFGLDDLGIGKSGPDKDKKSYQEQATPPMAQQGSSFQGGTVTNLGGGVSLYTPQRMDMGGQLFNPQNPGAGALGGIGGLAGMGLGGVGGLGGMGSGMRMAGQAGGIQDLLGSAAGSAIGKFAGSKLAGTALGALGGPIGMAVGTVAGPLISKGIGKIAGGLGNFFGKIF